MTDCPGYRSQMVINIPKLLLTVAGRGYSCSYACPIKAYIDQHARCVVNPSLCRCLTSIPIPNLLSAKLSVIPHPGRDETGHHPRTVCLRYVSAGTSWHAFQMCHTKWKSWDVRCWI
ncbi:hypothetical protein FOIG_03284 [Fusarium odoratissimum NRRL 54006]|uniref:Uncharacterized protein n=2 Tax=Fusarium oxysporum species complex TaxID=171631 RepID=X0JYZ2_FUSO5|nr:uncharacterized protein FOIG_03284 [Fusarium odoratissimum NRRL 54006]EXM06509.1 hypothetical protein FOIG_03284 [Fusarium odoratissimum NRRL 54006]TXC08440.1 hypothetical protein FocTR4_00003086 [Fusarium oxysporum f. sp. cubense]